MWGRMNKFECKESQNFVKKGHLISKNHNLMDRNLIDYFKLRFQNMQYKRMWGRKLILTQIEFCEIKVAL